MTAATGAMSIATNPGLTPAVDRGPAVMLKCAQGAAACLLLCCTAWAWAAPYVPSSEDEILARLPTGSSGWSAERRRRHAALAANRFDLQQAVSLARHYIERGRALSNPRHYGHAQAVLRPWWALQNPPAEILLLRANIRQNRHQFDSALRDLQQLLEQKPQHAQAWLTQAVILQVRGEYRQALASCVPLLRLASTLVATACTSSVASLSGRARDSYRLLLQAVRDSIQSEPGERLWALTVLADIAVRLGWHTRAEQHFQEALSINPRDHYLLAAYADLLLHQRRAAEVVTLLHTSDLRDANSLPTALLMRRVLADRQLAS